MTPYIVSVEKTDWQLVKVSSDAIEAVLICSQAISGTQERLYKREPL